MSDERTVFVVDDDHASASSMQALLTSIGLRVETRCSAEAFLAEFDGGRVGCLVLDYRLQGMDGLELQAALADRGWDVPIVMVTAHADRETSDKALENGAVACLEKPFDGETFCNLVRAALSRSEPSPWNAGRTQTKAS